MPTAEFDARMPVEFWREVVDRVAAEVPDTLLLAEAFWMLEGYFVRTLGMHRVYNSAFMHMLRDEDGAGYRKVMKETIEFDPEILKRYVNFMSNPDERTAIDQFGKGDKYFGVATLMATLPGLPMLGHGQVQGFGEKYGMEFRRATLEEQPDPWLLERHQREIFPLLHRRAWFAEARDFLLYDLITDGGTVDEDVFAYSNGTGPQRSLVLYHDRFASTSGWIRESASYVRRSASGAKRRIRRTLAEGLGLSDDPDAFVAFRDARTGLESIRSCREIRDRGFHVQLDAYGYHVFWEFREIHDGSSGQWARLAARLGEQAVPSLDGALRELQLEPVHAPLRSLFEDGLIGAVLDRTATDGRLDELEVRLATFLAAIAGATGVVGDPAAIAHEIRGRSELVMRGSDVPVDRAERAALLAWLTLARTGELASAADVATTSRVWFDELRLAGPLATGFRNAGLDEAAAWAVADRVRVLLALPRPSMLGGPAGTADLRLLDRWLESDVIRTAMGVNTWEGVEWLDRDRFVAVVDWAVRLDAIDAAAASRGFAERMTNAAVAAGYDVAQLRRRLGQASPTPTPRTPRRVADRPTKPPTKRPKA